MTRDMSSMTDNSCVLTGRGLLSTNIAGVKTPTWIPLSLRDIN